MKLIKCCGLTVFENDYIAQTLDKYGCWEPNITRFLVDQATHPYDFFLDIGAHYGYYGALNKEHNFSHSYLGVEANPITYEMCLMYNVGGCCINRFISNTDEIWSPPFHIFRHNTGGSRIDDRGDFRVRVAKAQSFLKKGSSTLLKIDVEGCELDVLKSIQDFSDIKTIVCEITPGVTNKFVVELLHNQGFKIMDIGCQERGNWQHSIFSLKEIKIPFYGQTNLVAQRS